MIVVGGGNSAGQAAIYLAQQGSRVSIAIRGDDLAHSMSHYLIERIEADPRIELLTSTEVRALAGDSHLEQRRRSSTRATGERRDVDCSGLFCFIGADPATAWLRGALELDAKGFILTDRSLPDPIDERAAVRGARSAAVRDVGPRRVRGRRRAQRLAEARRRRGRRGLERGAVGARPPRHRRPLTFHFTNMCRSRGLYDTGTTLARNYRRGRRASLRTT